MKLGSVGFVLVVIAVVFLVAVVASSVQTMVTKGTLVSHSVTETTTSSILGTSVSCSFVLKVLTSGGETFTFPGHNAGSCPVFQNNAPITIVMKTSLFGGPTLKSWSQP